MQYRPHDYQKYAIDYIEAHPIAAVLLDMGLGKTSITLTAIHDLLFDRFEVEKVLVIAPLRVARDTWPEEVKKWDHLKDLRLSVIVGTEAERLAALSRKADIYIINRENIPWLIEKSGYPFDYDMVVIDELSSFKNHEAQRFKALMKVRPKVKRIVGLTGTPAGNGLMDLWAEFKLLDGGKRLGRFISQYRMGFFRPDRRNGQVIFSYEPLPGAEEQIYEKISDITISMKAKDHLKMPELISAECPVAMSASEKKKYETMKKDLILKVMDVEITAVNAASLSNKLCQMANGAIYTEDKDVVELHKRKLDMLEDLIEQANGKPVLVAYWFKHDKKRIEERLDKIGIKYKPIESSESIEKWNKGELPVGLIHPASAGHGLNLQSGGNHIIWYGLTWSLELYQQTNARLWRQGQTEATVVVQHIICKDTIDERIMHAISEKDKTQSALIEAVKAEIAITRKKK